MLLNVLRKPLAYIGQVRLKYLDKKKNYSFIVDLYVQFPELVSKSATISKSQLSGKVIIGDYSKIIEARIAGNVSIGRWTTFNGPNSDIFAHVNKVRIGNFCSIARNVSIQEYNHIFDRATSYFVHLNVFGEKMENDISSKGDIIIGNDVWIGTQSVILSGATISDGAVIGANSVVDLFIPPYAIAVGSPAKVIKYRFSDRLVQCLLNLKWWDWDDEKVKRNRALFDGSLTEEKLDQVI